MFFIFNKIKNTILKFRINYLINKKFILHNKKYLNKKNDTTNGSVLVEFNSFTSNHVILSNLANVYSKKFNLEIVSFFNYSLTSSPAFFSIKRNIKWYLGIFFSLRFFKIYKSFNVRKFVKPQINKSIKNETKVIFNKIIQNLKTNEDILKIKIRDIHVGDLILDGYMYYKKVPRVDVSNKDFQNYLNDFISIFLFWKKYLENNNVKALIGVHATYAYGIIHRIAISKDIDVILNIGGKVHRLSKKNKYQNSEFKSFKEIYKNFSTDDKIKAIEISKYFLDNRFLGQTSTEINEYRITTSPFSLPYNNKKSVLNKNEKLKVIIFPHELNDCSNGQGINFFPDYVSWLEKIVEISKSTNFDWYAKNHPQFKGKFEKYQPYSHKLAESIFAKNPNIKILPSETSHHQIIGEGIDFGLTVNGDVAYEYAYFGVPILTATNNCNTSCYDFNIHSNNKEEYLNKIKNLDMLKKKKIDRNSVLECYFMMDIYNGELSLLENYFDYLKKNKSNLFYDTYFSNKIYNELLENWSDLKQKNLEITIKEFIESKDYILSCKHSKKSIVDLINIYQKK
jgi:hypothetical protein